MKKSVSRVGFRLLNFCIFSVLVQSDWILTFKIVWQEADWTGSRTGKVVNVIYGRVSQV